jgi:HNH endonuclease
MCQKPSALQARAGRGALPMRQGRRGEPFAPNRANRERLDPENGILLTAHLDAFFDAGLISFDDAGAILKATLLVDDGNPQLSVSGRLHRPPSEKMKKYLAYHRNIVFRNPSKPVS